MLSGRFLRFFRHLNWATLRKTFLRAGQRRLTGLSAEMAYNAMLALFPAILAILTAIGLFKSSASTFQHLARQLSEIAPKEAIFLIKGFTEEIAQSQNQGLFSLSFVVALWTASGAVSAAMTAFDQIHQIPPEQIRPFWKAKLISLGLTIGNILLLIVACFLVFISDWIVQMVAARSSFLQSELLAVWRLLSWPLALGMVASACAFIYRYGPSRWNQGTPIMPGAIVAALLWAIVSGLFRLYVSNFGNYNKVYGTVGTVIVLMLWLYMTSLVLLLGDQLNATVGEEMHQKANARKEALEAASDAESEAS
jgi:membrane protein